MKILFLSRWFPYPPDNGSKLRIYHLLQGLVQFHEVDLISFSDQPESDITAAHKIGCKSVRTVQWRKFNPRSWRGALGLFGKTPRSLTDTYSRDMERDICNTVQNEKYELVISSQWQMNAYRHCHAYVPSLMEEIESGVLQDQYKNATSLHRRLRSGLTWYKYTRYLAHLLQDNQPCTVVSEQERRILKTVAPRNAAIHVIPNGVHLAGYSSYQDEPEPDSLIYTGSFRYYPNYEAMKWFLEYVYPLMRKHIPELRVTITGEHLDLPLPYRKEITLTGHVEDVRKLIRSSWASIAPLKVGGGTRLKILESMALRVPVVSTGKGAEGLDAKDGIHLYIADTPEVFAERTIQLLQNRSQRDLLAENAFELVRQNYDWQVIMPNFLQVVEMAAGRN